VRARDRASIRDPDRRPRVRSASASPRGSYLHIYDGAEPIAPAPIIVPEPVPPAAGSSPSTKRPSSRRRATLERRSPSSTRSIEVAKEEAHARVHPNASPGTAATCASSSRRGRTRPIPRSSFARRKPRPAGTRRTLPPAGTHSTRDRRQPAHHELAPARVVRQHLLDRRLRPARHPSAPPGPLPERSTKRWTSNGSGSRHRRDQLRRGERQPRRHRSSRSLRGGPCHDDTARVHRREGAAETCRRPP